MDSTRLRVEISKGSVEPVSCGVIRSTATGAKAWHQILHMFNMPTSRVLLRRPSTNHLTHYYAPPWEQWFIGSFLIVASHLYWVYSRPPPNLAIGSFIFNRTCLTSDGCICNNAYAGLALSMCNHVRYQSLLVAILVLCQVCSLSQVFFSHWSCLSIISAACSR
jgi:hypothetical protein